MQGFMWAQGREGLQLLYEISVLLSESGDIETILKPVLDRIAVNLGALRGMISIINRNRQEIGITEAWGLDDSQKSRGRYFLGEGITGKVIETGNPVAINCIADEPSFLNRTGARDTVESLDTSFVCVPIYIDAEVIGAISIDLPGRSEPLDYELQLLSIVAASISQAVRLRQTHDEELEDLKAENSRLQEELRRWSVKPVSIIGNSSVMQDLYVQIQQVGATNATVLILGESGVGKERFAQAIHETSKRVDKPFVKVNCAAIPESLIESSLFGHEKGAFTGAVSRQKGYFEKADGGTIFLDEIGDLPLAAQAKFLRILQEREFERIGGTETIKVDIRVIAASNQDLEKLIGEGKFREDLYYRLSVFPLVIPPLRERKSDIMLLVDHFVEKFTGINGKTIKSISPQAEALLTAYRWPGNVRELENCIERATILSTDGIIHNYHLPPSVQKNVTLAKEGPRRSLQEVLDTVEREIIESELRRTKGNCARAAYNLGISERIMGLRVKKYRLKEIGKE